MQTTRKRHELGEERTKEAGSPVEAKRPFHRWKKKFGKPCFLEEPAQLGFESRGTRDHVKGPIRPSFIEVAITCKVLSSSAENDSRCTQTPLIPTWTMPT